MLATLLVSMLTVILVVVIHYEVLNFIARHLGALGIANHRSGIVVILLLITVAHVIEIWCFAFAYFFLLMFDGVGQFTGMGANPDILDYAYFSFVCYTTLGFGDIVPEGFIRFLSGTEALTGLVLITWTASFLFMQMENHWKD